MKVLEIFGMTALLLYSHNRKFSFQNFLNRESYKSCKQYVTNTAISLNSRKYCTHVQSNKYYDHVEKYY